MAVNYNIPTPTQYARIMLDSIGYKKEILDKRILENSCGEGAILLEVVKRYVREARNQNYSNDAIKKGLEENVLGIEININRVNQCIKNLNHLRISLGLPFVNWNIINGDYLKTEFINIDYIISNPPYINYHDLSTAQREFLNLNFESCKKGRFDFYYAFIEKGLSELSSEGVFTFLIPFSFFRNKYAFYLRKEIVPLLTHVYDFSNISIFDNAEIKSVLITGNNYSKKKNFRYINKYRKINQNINKASFDLDIANFIKIRKGSMRVGDFFKIANSIATLHNETYLVEITDEDSNYYYSNDLALEKELLCSVISNKIKSSSKLIKLIFPYIEIDGEYKLIDEIYLKNTFPNIYAYLSSKKQELDKRALMDQSKWYEFGRSQGIQSIKHQKLILPKVFSENFNTYLSNSGEVPIAGYYAIEKLNSELSILDLQKILATHQFKEYVRNMGTPVSNHSYNMSVSLLLNYEFEYDIK